MRTFLVDFSKAFGLVKHSLLLDKIAKLPLTPAVFNRFVDFLAGRQQRVIFNGQKTTFLSINRGIPQGTVSGTLLYAFFVDDLKPINDHVRLSKYADDGTSTVPVYSGHADCSREEVENSQTCCQRNAMKLNLIKTKEILCFFFQTVS